MNLRSLLFVPGDRPERMEKALGLGADALILDLEDSVALATKMSARRTIASFLGASHRTVKLLVRINPLDGALVEDDLAAIVPAEPDAIVLPKAEGAESIEALDRHLQRLGADGIPILPIATETPRAIFQLGSYATVSGRLCGLTWGAEDLPAAIGAVTSREVDGSYTPPYELARSLTLFAAHAASVPAVETVYPNFRDIDGLTAYATRAARDGFTGMMAIHPSQVSVINRAFTPSEEAIAHAQAVIAAFEANPDAGVLQLDGKMIDAPHLKQARSLIARTGR